MSDRPLKIALVGENYFPTLGGIQEHIYHLARQLMARGHGVRVLTGMPAQTGPWRGPTDEPWVVRVGKSRRVSAMGSRTTFTLGPGIVRALGRILAAERFDLIHVHAPCDFGLPMALYAALRAGGHDVPVVGTLHSPMYGRSWVRRPLAPYYQWVLGRRCDIVISVSEAARTAMGRYARFASRVLPNGVDSGALARGKPLARYADGKVNLLMLGRLEPRNGPDILLAALPRILARRPDVRLLVAGEGKNGIADHQALVPSEARANVEFLGAVYEERADVYASARLCVVPARSGTFSIIILEALAAGVPVVATPFVAGWRNERHFAPVTVTADFSPDTVADAVLAALAEDPAARIAAGRAVAESFDWRHVAAQVEDVYRECLAGRRRDPGAPPLPATVS